MEFNNQKVRRDDIRKLATRAGIKNSTKQSLESLCKILNIDYVPGKRNLVKPFYVKDLETGTITKYRSGYEVMKKLCESVRIYQYTKTGNPITIKGKKYMLQR